MDIYIVVVEEDGYKYMACDFSGDQCEGERQVPLNVTAEGSSVSFVFPSAVMALDFHDSQPVKDMPPSFTCNCTRCGQVTEVCGYNVEWNCVGCGELCGILAGY